MLNYIYSTVLFFFCNILVQPSTIVGKTFSRNYLQTFQHTCATIHAKNNIRIFLVQVYDFFFGKFRDSHITISFNKRKSLDVINNITSKYISIQKRFLMSQTKWRKRKKKGNWDSSIFKDSNFVYIKGSTNMREIICTYIYYIFHRRIPQISHTLMKYCQNVLHFCTILLCYFLY